MISIQALEAVIALAVLGNFRMAAEKLDVSRPTLTRLIQRAEAKCGVTIFDRAGSGVQLTPSGRELVERFRVFDVAVEDFLRDIDNIGKSDGTLLIGCGHLATRSLVEPALIDLMESLPDVRARVMVRGNKDPLHGLLDRSIDVFIGDLTHTPEFAGLEIQAVKRFEVIFVAHPEHPVHETGPQPLGKVMRYPLILARLNKHWRSFFLHALAEQDGERHQMTKFLTVECDDMALSSSLVQHSNFVTAGTRENFVDKLEAGLLRQVEITDSVTWNACVARRENASYPALDLFWNSILKVKDT